MVRDTEEGKTDFTYVLPGPMLERWAIHLMKGAVKYDKNNWLKAKTQAALDRYERSALRHIRQWITGENTWEYDEDLDEWVEIIEDHAAAVLFNINGAEYVRAILEKAAKAEDKGPGAVLTTGLLADTIDAYVDTLDPPFDFIEPQLYNFLPRSQTAQAWDALFGPWLSVGDDVAHIRAQRERHQELAEDFSKYVGQYWADKEKAAEVAKASEVYNAKVVEENMNSSVVPGWADTHGCGDDECGCGPR